MLRLRPRRAPDNMDLVTKALKVAQTPALLNELPPKERRAVDEVAKAIQMGSSWTRPGANSGTVAQIARARPVSATAVARNAAERLNPNGGPTPLEIETAMRNQGLDWVAPFAPGTPLQPYYGYNRRPRERDYPVGRNITTDTRPGRIPFSTLRQLVDSYDVASICIRHAIQDLRSMRVRFEPMDGYEDNPVKEIAAAKEFWRRPDGILSLKNWMCKHAMDVWRFDAGTLYRQRDRSGRLIALPVPDGTLFAPMLDYFGTNPTGEAPAFQQFIQGIPWDWMRWEDLIYEPMWPHTEDPYGVAPIETVLINANTDLRLQTYFLQFFTQGQVPEAFALAPEDQSDADSLADWQEQWNDWTFGDQSERWGLRWLPHGTELEFYKPQQFDPDVAEYVMRRTVAAFMMVPQDLGFTDNLNRSSSETQVDTQFRINSLPNVSYYEDLMDSVTQKDLGLPVQIRFDTGREKEDRLMEARAHQIYVSIGAESSDEVRSKVLGYPVNPEERVPRFFDSVRLGPIPIEYLLSVAGDVDPLTGAPRPGTVQRREFLLPGATGALPPAEGTQYDDNPEHGLNASGRGPKAKRWDPTKTYPKPPVALPREGRPAGKPAAPRPRPAAGPLGAHPDEATGYGHSQRVHLSQWRSQSRSRVAKGRAPRPFMDSAISEDVYALVWKSLKDATTREEVDAAFAKARPKVAGVALVAKDTGRVLLVQRANKHG